MTELNLHPLCAMWPQMSDADLDVLAADIKANGLREPIVRMPDGATLDGRNREIACARAGVEARTIPYDPEQHGSDVLAFVVSRNLARRHLTDQERAMIGGEIANLKNGLRKDNSASVITEGEAITQADAAKLMKVSIHAIADAIALKTHAAPNVVEMVKARAVGMQSAGLAARGTPKTEQANWTPTDVKRIAAAKKAPNGSSPKGKSTSKRQKRINPPYMDLRRPEPGEVLRPAADAPIEEHAAFNEKYGRTILHPTKIADLLNEQALVEDFVLAISNLASARHPDINQFLAGLDHMRAHVVQRGKTNGEQIDFSKSAREALGRIERDLDTAIERLTTLRERLAPVEIEDVSISA